MRSSKKNPFGLMNIRYSDVNLGIEYPFIKWVCAKKLTHLNPFREKY